MATATPTPKVVKAAGQDGPSIWKKIVERKWLFIAIAVHVIFGIVATIWVVSEQSVTRKKFMAPGAAPEAARQGAEHKVSLGRKQSTMSAPEQAKRVTTSSAFAKVALPEMPEMPTATTDVFANRAIGMGGTGNAFGATGTPGGGGGGGGSGINFFGLRTRAKSIVFVLDVSDSMVMSPAPPPTPPGQLASNLPPKLNKSPQTYNALERYVVSLINQLDPSLNFGVVAFAGDVQPYKPMLTVANNADKAGAIKFIRERNPGLNIVNERKAAEREAAGFKPANTGKTVTGFNHGGTRTRAALEYAFAMNPDAICLVSDGIPTDGGYGGKEILALVQEKQKELPRPAVINVVAYLADGGQKFMQDLAQQNQGGFKEIKPGMQWGF